MKKAAIKIQNGYSWLITNSDDVSHTLWNSLRFRAKGYYHSRLYKQHKWDGFDEFYKKESGRFLTGLLPEVEAALKFMDVTYRLMDERKPFKFRHETIDQDFLKQYRPDLNIRLEDYQSDLTNQVIKYGRGIVVAPTSAGKTYIMLSILKSLPDNTPTLILANKKSLVEQNYQELIDWGFKGVGRVYDKYVEPNMITCSTIHSVDKIAKLLPKIKCLVVDEIHELMSKRPTKCYNQLKECNIRVGVSATPFKFGGSDKSQKYQVKGYFGPILRTSSALANEKGILTTAKLQEVGRLSKANCNFYPISEPQIPYAVYIDAVTQGIANNWPFHNLVKTLARKQTGRTLILVERTTHGDFLKELIPDALWIRGQDTIETRKEVIKQLQSNDGNVIAIATQGIFNTGINVFIHNLINAAGGTAEHQIIQRFGRGLRTAKDKDILNYYDFVFKINEYLEKHSKHRIKILRNEGHNVTIHKEIDF